MAFNWDDHPIVEAASEGSEKKKSFDWDEHPIVESAKKQYTSGEAATMGAQNSLAFGLRPAVKGVAGFLGSGLGTYLGARNRGEDIGPAASQAYEAAKESYEPSRKEAYEEQEQAHEQHPYAYNTGSIGGAIATAPLIAAKGLKGAAALGAGYGVTEGVSRGETGLGEMASNAIQGAGTGMATHGLIQGAIRGGGAAIRGGAKLAKKVAPNFKPGDLLPSFNKMGETVTGIPENDIKTYRSLKPEIDNMAVKYDNNAFNATEDARKAGNQAIEATKDRIQTPARQAIQSEAESNSSREAGDKIKQQIIKDVSEKYAPFKKAYGDLEKFAEKQIISDEGKIKFGDDVKSWALDEFPQNSDQYNAVKKYVDSFQAANNGKQFQNVLLHLKAEVRGIFNSANGNKEMGKVLSTLQTKADSFYENQIEGIARRIDAGDANIFNSLSGMHPDQARASALEYLQSKNRIDSEYANFKRFMEGLSEQTKTKGKGAQSFIENLKDTPSEKLVDKMFDKSNSAALEELKAKSPLAFDALSKHKIGQLVEKSTVDGKLDVPTFHEEMQKLPKEIQALMFNKELQSTVQSTAKDATLGRINELTNKGANKSLFKPGEAEGTFVAAGNKTNPRAREVLKEMSDITGKDLVSPAEKVSAMRTFGNPSNLPIDMTGKSVARQKVAGGIVGGLAGGTGLLLGLDKTTAGGLAFAGNKVGQLLASPAMLKRAINAGQITSDIANRLVNNPRVKNMIPKESLAVLMNQAAIQSAVRSRPTQGLMNAQ